MKPLRLNPVRDEDVRGVFDSAFQARRFDHNSFSGHEKIGLISTDKARELHESSKVPLYNVRPGEYVFVIPRFDGYERVELLTREYGG